jgi:putative phage-type endonuclease
MRHSHPHRIKNLDGIPGPILTPGSDEWRRSMSASKVAAVVGLSPFMSRFALWHEMAGNVARDVESTAMSRGHLLEPAVADWFAAQHPDWKIIPTGTWTHAETPWATATPDRLVLVPGEGARTLEIKTATYSDDWGAAGSDQIPPGYRCQVVWSMFVTGATVGHVAVLLPFLEFREYVIEYDHDEAIFLFESAAQFLDDLAQGNAPDLDGSDSTYQTVRELHPDIDDIEVEIADELAVHLAYTKAAAEEAATAHTQAKSWVLDAMGTARKATCNGLPIATRSAKNGGTPYLSLSRSLPTPAQILASRKEPAA